MALSRHTSLLLALTLAAGTLPGQAAGPKRPLILLLSAYAHPERDLAAATLGGMARRNGVEFDAYYSTARADGGIFSAHGSTLLGGRHDVAIARALAKYDTVVVRLGDTYVFESATAKAATLNLRAPTALSAAMELASKMRWPFPKTAIAVQTVGLSEEIKDIHAYLFPEVVHRQAVAVPLEAPPADLKLLVAQGVKEVLTIGTKGNVPLAWKELGLSVQAAEEFTSSDTLYSVTFRIAQRWADRSTGIDLCEPVMAGHWVPFSIRENRLQMCSRPTTKQAIDGIVELARDWPEPVVYGRWGGGSVKGVGDFGLFPLFRKHLSVQVSEPGRPVLTLFSKDPDPLPQPARSPFDFEPSDEQLRKWAQEARILATYVLHSGELSHDDGVIPFVEYSGTRRIPIGMGVHWQRYWFEPWSLEAIQIPHTEGGALGYVEPVLHSTGHGILAEREGDPKRVASLMRSARDRIAAVAGKRFVPRGVYCFLDADMKNWDSPALELWKSIRDAGFEYVISSVASGENKLLYRDGSFVVLNMIGRRTKASPFVRHHNVEMPGLEKQLREAGNPGWLIGVLDTPLYGYSPYLSEGHKWGFFVRINELYDYIDKGRKEQNLIPASPRTIARYARMLADMGLLSQ